MNTPTNTDWLQRAIHPIDAASETRARERQEQLTKPPGSLGELENLAIFLAARQGREKPCVDSVWISIFAGDHGVVEEGISAFPQAVTVEMIKNFSRGGAAICVLAKKLAAHLEVIDLGSAVALSGVPGVTHLNLGAGTANFAKQPAMTEAQCAAALDAGRQSVKAASHAGAELFIGGEMGIGNTTSAAALACALLGESPKNLSGPGTGLNPAGVAHKAAVIANALAFHDGQLTTPFDILRRLGGFEIAALTGAYLACAQQGITALVDGFIATTAALLAERIAPGSARWFLYGHSSAEPGHARVLAALSAQPILNLHLRLGEGSGAALAVPMLQLACALHNEMATFAEAAVSVRNQGS